MLNKIKTLALATAVTIAMPIASYAATISGQIDISGTVNLNTSDFSAGGNADLNNPGFVSYATGDFDTFVNVPDAVNLTDIDFTAPGAIWNVGGFTFVAHAFSDFIDNAVKSFTAGGTISGNGFDDTLGTLTFTSQTNDPAVTVSFSSTTTPVPVPAAGLLLIAGLGSLVVAGRKKAA